jgi:hypothetical protein
VEPPEHVLDVSKATAKVNFEIGKTRLKRIASLS